MPAKAERNQPPRHPGRWKPGQSGNPRGKPKGCRDHATRAAEALLEGEAETLTRQAVALALEGDTVALRLCLERIIPARRDATLRMDLPPIEGVADVPAALCALVAAVADGSLTPSEAQGLAGLVSQAGRAWEATEFEARLRALEEARDAT